jgi:lipopolysaccharide export system protein LptC
MASDPYSRLIAFLKILLPLLALGILSTIFLVSSRVETTNSIPFAEDEIAQRIRSQQVTGALFSGVTTGGDRISFTADEIVTDPDNVQVARSPVAEIDFSAGGGVRLESERGHVDLAADLAVMEGRVVIRDTSGYVMRSEEISSRLSSLDVVSPGEVTADGPPGTLRAGKMRIGKQGSGDNVHLLFTDGVKLVYDPKETE